MKKKSFLLSFLILLTLFSLVGCKKHSSGEALSKVTLNEVAHSIFYAPQYVAIQEGWITDLAVAPHDSTVLTLPIASFELPKKE